MPQQIKATLFNINLWLLPLLTVVVIPWSVWATNKLYSHDAVINQGGRFTNESGLELELRLLERIAALQERIDRKNEEQDSVVALKFGVIEKSLLENQLTLARIEEQLKSRQQ